MEFYIFDRTFEGLLTAVFEFYDRKGKIVKLMSHDTYQPGLLDDEVTFIISDKQKAARVWKGLQKKISTNWQNTFFKAFLSENESVWNDLFEFSRYVFDNPKGVENDFGNKYVLEISQTAKKVNREKHRMKAFIRFQKTADGIYYAAVEPDFNVLPLIVSFFKNRYADQKWVIYDIRRKYGLFYDLNSVEEISYEFALNINASRLPAEAMDAKEELSSLLWKDYFDSTNITERKNMKLHIQHVPKRYWKYLNEKKGKN